MKNNNLYKTFNGFKTKTEAYKYFGFHDNNVGIVKLKNIAESVGFDLETYKIKRKSKKLFCLNCNKELKRGQKKFCSSSCSATFSNSNRIISDNTKQKISKTLSKQKNEKIKLCKICGQKKCINLEICNHTKNWFLNLISFGFDINLLKTIKIYNEYYRIKDLILKEYFDNGLSPSDIAIKYNYNKNSENILHILKSFGIKTRNLSESEINAYLQNKLNNTMNDNDTNYQFKHGWHITWNNKKIYYRSSYELNFAKTLDAKNINYEVEYFRIKYWDSQKCKYRVAIPDFYIPTEKKLIEIKSKVTFNKQNIIDKFNEYEKMGFEISLIYEGKEYNFQEIYQIKQNEYII